MVANVESMFYVGATPWHNLGTKLPQLATAHEALEAAGLNWRVTKEPLYLNSGEVVPGYCATVRSSDKTALGVVHETYEPIQNAELFEFADDILQASSGAHFETAGSLGHGERVWTLARLPETVEIVKGDPTQFYLLLSSSHNGTFALGAHIVPTRVVCQNTLNIALHSAKRSFSCKHTKNARDRMEQAKYALGLTHKYILSFEEELRGMAQRVATVDIERVFIDRVIPLPEEKGRARTIAEDARYRLQVQLARGPGMDIPGVSGTMYGLFMAASDYADHYLAARKPSAEQTAVTTTIAGNRMDFKDKAWSTLLQLTRLQLAS